MTAARKTSAVGFVPVEMRGDAVPSLWPIDDVSRGLGRGIIGAGGSGFAWSIRSGYKHMKVPVLVGPAADLVLAAVASLTPEVATMLAQAPGAAYPTCSPALATVATAALDEITAALERIRAAAVTLQRVLAVETTKSAP